MNNTKLKSKLGMTLLAAWLIIGGIGHFTTMPKEMGLIMAILAIASGVMILMGK